MYFDCINNSNTSYVVCAVRDYRLDILEWNSVTCSEKCQQDACGVNQGQSSYGREAPVIFSINLSPTEGQKLLRRARATGRLNKALQGFCFAQLEAMDHATTDQWHKTLPYKGTWTGIAQSVQRSLRTGWSEDRILSGRRDFPPSFTPVLGPIQPPKQWVPGRGEFRPRQLPRAVDLKGRLLSCQSY